MPKPTTPPVPPVAITGTKGNDTLSGTSKGETINGLDGNDTITGNGGGDRISGGKGADTFVYTDLGDTNAASGIDTINDFNPLADRIDLTAIRTALGDPLYFVGGTVVAGFPKPQVTLSFDAALNRTTLSVYPANSTTPNFQIYFTGQFTTLAGIFGVTPAVVGTSADDQGPGRVIGTDSSEGLFGLAGDDFLDPKLGDDYVDGGDGDDATFVFFEEATAGVTFNLSSGTAVQTDAGIKQFVNIEHALMFGSEFADMLTGGSASDYIEGNGGDDTINGADGMDNLVAEDGDDTINGGNGDDLLSGGTGDDVLNGDADADTVDGGDGNDSLLDHDGFSGDVLQGGAGDDYIYSQWHWSDSGEGDTLDGGDGNDLLVSEYGGDILIGGNGSDSIDAGYYFHTTEGTIVKYMSLAEGGDTIAFFKSAVSPGSRPDKIDLSEVDDPNTVGDDVWAFAGSAYDSSITGPQATITLVGGNSVLSLYSADGDDLADFTISLNNVSLQPGDVIW